MSCTDLQSKKKNYIAIGPYIYTWGQEIGRGGFGVVYSGIRENDKRKVAIKMIKKNLKHIDWVTKNGVIIPNELYLMLKVAHIPGCIEILDYCDRDEEILLVMEQPDQCIDLFDFITKRGYLSEKMARNFFRQIVEIVIDVQKAGVIHGDIKSENILIDCTTMQLKLFDFGYGELVKDTPITKFAGTGLFCTPEWLLYKHYYGHSATIWTLGTLLFDMVCGKPPFNGADQIMEANVTFGDIELSDDAKDLVRKCLSLEPIDRPSLDEILRHPWMSKV